MKYRYLGIELRCTHFTWEFDFVRAATRDERTSGTKAERENCRSAQRS